MHYLVKLYAFFKPYQQQLVIGSLSVLLSSVFAMTSPYLIKFAIQFGLKPHTVDHQLVIDGNFWFLVLACAAVVTFAIGRGLAGFGMQYLGQTVGQDASYDIRNAIFNNLQSLSYGYHDKVQTGQVMSRITQDVESVRMFPQMGIMRLLQIVVMLAVALVGMFLINWQLALISLVTLPFMVWRSIVLATTIRPIWLQVQQNIGEIARVGEEALSGIRVVKAFSREDFESSKFREVSMTSADLSYKAAKIQAVNQPILIGLGTLQIAITMAFGAWQITTGDLAAADLLTFALLLNLLQLPIRTIGFSINSIMRCISSSERIFELLDAQSAVQEKPDALDLANPVGNVRFEGVGFAYDNLSAVLDDVSLEANPGDVVALLGPPGSGKTTLVNLIPRFYDVSAGRVTIDGHDVRDLTLASLRKNIGVVQQDVFLFIGTIRENIAYGRPEASQEEIIAAAKAARIHDFIMSLPMGYDEWVGERGVTLSGGQKQRIAIARTLLIDPKILILDDSTASVDMQTEFLIQQALSDLMSGRTTFVIAQRLRTIMRADEIIVLDRGKVVERGKHSELIQHDGLYRRIYDLELKDQDEALGRAGAQAADGTAMPADAAASESITPSGS
ncbi:MAG TPA: ABC transporter ATP-binding protein [Dehalococcoidia bacterium]